jgi:hypothetical protein
MGCRGWRRRISERTVDECIGNSNAILPMITVAGVPPFHSDAIEAEQLIERQIRRNIQYRWI